MNRYTPLIEIAEFRIGRFDHPQQDYHRDPALEVARSYSINRVARGRFSVKIGKLFWELTTGDLFLSYPGMEYRCIHHQEIPEDVCMTLDYSPSLESPEETEGFERAVRLKPVLRASNRMAYLFLQLARRSRERIAVEESAHCLMAEIVAHSGLVPRNYSESRLSWYAERVDAVCWQMDHHYAADHSLAACARSVGMSSFHFARIFRELAGIPPHSYLRLVRLKQAGRRLREGASVTEACFDSGFQNLSHFSRQFYRHFGVKPSAYARQTTR